MLYELIVLMVLGSSNNKLLLVHYGKNNTHNVLSINNIKYRETSTFSPSYFPVKINDKPNISGDVISIDEIINYDRYNFVSGLQNYIIRENTKTKFENLIFDINKNILVHLLCKFSAVPFDNSNNSRILVKLYMNDLELYSKNLSNATTVIFNKQIYLDKGSYNLYFIVYSENMWCSCPETKDGFYMSRFLSKWEYSNKKSQINKKNKINKINKINIGILPKQLLIFPLFHILRNDNFNKDWIITYLPTFTD